MVLLLIIGVVICTSQCKHLFSLYIPAKKSERERESRYRGFVVLDRNT